MQKRKAAPKRLHLESRTNEEVEDPQTSPTNKPQSVGQDTAQGGAAHDCSATSSQGNDPQRSIDAESQLLPTEESQDALAMYFEDTPLSIPSDYEDFGSMSLGSSVGSSIPEIVKNFVDMFDRAPDDEDS